MDAMNEVIIAPDFLALGLGGTNMMSMLWTVAMGRQAVGVEMRGDPFLGVHWNIREDFYHQLGLIDQMMLERYGEVKLPRRGDGRIFSLADCFYSPQTVSGDIVADEIIDGFDTDQHIVGTIQHVEFIDDRWRDGLPNRVITLLEPPTPPDQPDPRKIRTSMVDVLDGPSTFQAEAASIQKLLRRYLELIEQQDLDNNLKPRVRLFTHHRVVPADGDGFIHCPDGRKQIRIEALQEFDFKGQFVRVREPGSEVIDLGVPELFMIAQGFSSSYAKRLGFEQQDVKVDHGDGYGPTLFSLVERVGSDPLVAANGVVAGDSFGNGHFLTSGGAMTGMIGHSARVLEYWQSRDAGTSPADGIRRLADSIREDTHAWLQVSAKEYSQAAPINFGAERIEQISKASGIDTSVRANAIDAARRQRHALIPLDPSNWRRLFVRNGRVLSALPELDDDHPLQRPEHEASLLAVLKSLPVIPRQVSSKLSTDRELGEGEQTVLRSKLSI